MLLMSSDQNSMDDNNESVENKYLNFITYLDYRIIRCRLQASSLYDYLSPLSPFLRLLCNMTSLSQLVVYFCYNFPLFYGTNSLICIRLLSLLFLFNYMTNIISNGLLFKLRFNFLLHFAFTLRLAVEQNTYKHRFIIIS